MASMRVATNDADALAGANPRRRRMKVSIEPASDPHKRETILTRSTASGVR